MKITIVQGPFLPVPPLLGGAVEKIWFALGKYFASKGHLVTHISRQFDDLPFAEIINGVKHLRIPANDAPSNKFLFRLFELIYSLYAAKAIPDSEITLTNSVILPLLLRKKRFGKIYVRLGRYPKGQTKFYSHVSRIQTLTNAVAKAISEEIPGSEARIKVIPNFVPASFIPENSLEAISSKTKTAIFVGRIHPEKGLELLLHSWQLLPAEIRDNWTLKFIGPWEIKAGGGGESYLKKLQGIAAKNQNIEFTGPVFDAVELQNEYLRAKVFLYPSLAEKGETFGLSVLEAMARGCAPVVSALECFKDFVEDKSTGLVFNHRSQDPQQELAIALETLLNDDILQRYIGLNALEQARNFTLEKVGDMYLQDFATLLKKENK